jgi:hypothetical protein
MVSKKHQLAVGNNYLKKIIKHSDGCWDWVGAITAGYGTIRVEGKHVPTHRFVYEKLKKVKIPSGYVIDHLCKNTRCVNPDHLEVVTHGENTSRGIHQQRKYCKHGHELTDDNVYIYKSDGGRRCLTCRKHYEKYKDLFYKRKSRKRII